MKSMSVLGCRTISASLRVADLEATRGTGRKGMVMLLELHAVHLVEVSRHLPGGELGEVLEARRVVSLEQWAGHAASLDDRHDQRLERRPVELLELLVAHEAAGAAVHGDKDARVPGHLHGHR